MPHVIERLMSGPALPDLAGPPRSQPGANRPLIRAARTPASVLTVPPEVLGLIVRQLDWSDILHLSCAHSALRCATSMVQVPLKSSIFNVRGAAFPYPAHFPIKDTVSEPISSGSIHDMLDAGRCQRVEMPC